MEIPTTWERHISIKEPYNNRKFTDYFVDNQTIHNRITEGSTLISVDQHIICKHFFVRFIIDLTPERWAKSFIETLME